jgi:hypothetical protein
MMAKSDRLAACCLVALVPAGAALAAPEQPAPVGPPAPRVSSHFHLSTLGDRRSERLERETLAALEAWYRSYQIAFEIELEVPVTVLLYPQQIFHHSTGAPNWADGVYEEDAGIRIATGGVARLERDLERVLAHKLAHAFITRRSGGRAPRWLQEGLAQALSLAPSASVSATARLAAGSLAALDYNGCLEFVQALIRVHGLETLMEVLTDLDRGLTTDEAFSVSAGATARQLYEEWSARPRGSPGAGGPGGQK